MCTLLQRWVEGNQAFTLEELMRYDIFAHKEFISEISGTASGEAQLEASLTKITKAWSETEFVTKPYRELKHVYILGGLEDVFTQLEDHQVLLQTMMGSRYIAGVQADVETWERKLSLLSDTLDEWVNCQRSWMYLETIFSAEDIQKQLPAEAAKFHTVDKKVRAHLDDFCCCCVPRGDRVFALRCACCGCCCSRSGERHCCARTTIPT